MSQKFEMINNTKCYAPELAKANADYPAEVFKFMYEAENSNFWFISRNKVIQHLFNKHIGNKEADILEIGCGTGYVLKGLQDNFSDYNLFGSEIHLEGIKFAKKRLSDVEFIQLDATQMPFNDTFDAVGAFDVLEHIEEDEQVMKEVHKSLRPQGHFFISVPQYQWMWSKTDDIAFHKRRYVRKELRSKLEKAGFEVVYMGSFVFSLFPFMFVSRFFKKNRNKEVQVSTEAFKEELNELKLNPILNKILLGVMKIDEVLIKAGFSLPFGGSLMAVARKNK